MARLSRSPSLLISGSGRWPQLATGTQILRAKMTSLTWCDFLQGKQVGLSLSRSLLPQKTKNLPLVKKFELDLWASLPSAEQINYLPRQLIDLRDTDKSRFFTLTELNNVNPLLSPPSLISPPPPPLLRGGKLIAPSPSPPSLFFTTINVDWSVMVYSGWKFILFLVFVSMTSNFIITLNFFNFML